MPCCAVGIPRRGYESSGAATCCASSNKSRRNRIRRRRSSVLLERLRRDRKREHRLTDPASAGIGKLSGQFREVLTCELPLEWPGGPLPVVLKFEEPLGERVEVREVIGRQDLPLTD